MVKFFVDINFSSEKVTKIIIEEKLMSTKIITDKVFKDTFERRKQSFISVFSICMTAPLRITSNDKLSSFSELLELPQLL